MDLRWLDPQEPSVSDLAGMVALLEAARVVDSPHEPSPLTGEFLADLRHGWDGDPPRAAISRDADGRPVGLLQVALGRWDNTHLGWVGITVHPAHRRRGLGSALFKAGVEEVRGAGRSLVLADSWADSAGSAFADVARTREGERRCQAPAGPGDARPEPHRRSPRRGRGRMRWAYELVRIAGPVPAELRADVAAMTGAINDAPTDDLDVEDEVFSAERIEAFENAQLGQDRRIYRLVARQRETGQLAGHTMVAIPAQRPWLAWQLDTSVVRAHRGHRLGLILKCEMLGWLAEAEPQLAELTTWNAASNALHDRRQRDPRIPGAGERVHVAAAPLADRRPVSAVACPDCRGGRRR